MYAMVVFFGGGTSVGGGVGQMRYVGIGQSYLQCTAVLHGAVLVDPTSVTAPVVVSVALSSAAIHGRPLPRPSYCLEGEGRPL